MSGTDYDDSNPAILYSSGWTAQTGTTSQQFMSTSHTTTVKGASATIKFQGSRIVLYLTVPQGSGEESIGWTLDGGNPGTNTRHRHDGTTYYQDNWYDSGPISNGAHTFVVSNAEDGAPFVFDKVNIIGTLLSAHQAAAAPAPAVPKPTTTTTTTTPQPPATTQAQQQSQIQTQTQTQVQTVLSTQVQTVAATVAETTGGSITASPAATGAMSNSSGGAVSSPTTLSGLPQSRNIISSAGGTIFVSTQYVTTGANGATSTVHTVTEVAVSTSSPSFKSAAQKSSFPVGAVIGGVIGALALIILGFISLCLLRRRKSKRQFGMLQEPGQDMEREVPEHRRLSDISPFRVNTVVDRLGGRGADVSRSASNSSGTSGNILSEKAQLRLRDLSSSNEHSASQASPVITPTATTSSPFSPTPQQALLRHTTEIDAGTFNLQDPDFDTTGMVLAYVPVNHLLQGPRASHGAPPSYQSAATRTNNRLEDGSNLSTSTLSYVAPVSATAQDDLVCVDPLPPVSADEVHKY